jgi:hypothetical protein
MVRHFLFRLLGAAGLCLAGAVTALTVRPPDRAAAQPPTEVGRYQLVALTGTAAGAPEWILFHPESGSMEHWRVGGGGYVVRRLTHGGTSAVPERRLGTRPEVERTR